MDVVGQAFDREVDRVDRRLHLVFVGHREQRLVDLDVLAAGRDQQLEIVAQQLAEIVHHLRDVVVVLVVGDLRQHVRAGHGDLDRPCASAPTPS